MKKLTVMILAASVSGGLAMSTGTAQAASIGYWRFEEGSTGAAITTTPSETNAASLPGTGSGNARYSNDRPADYILDPVLGYTVPNSGSVRFSSGAGSHGEIRIADDPLLNTSPFTVEIFARIDGTSPFHTSYLHRWISHEPIQGWTFTFNPNSTIARTRSDGIQDDPLKEQPVNKIIAGGTLMNDTWHHLAYVYDGDFAHLYLDYSLIGSADLRGGTAEGRLYLGEDLVLEKSSSIDNVTMTFDELRYSDAALAPNEFLVATSQAVPEPSTAGLVCIAGAALFAAGRRRWRHSLCRSLPSGNG